MPKIPYKCSFCNREFRSGRTRNDERLCANCIELRRLIRGWQKKGMWVTEAGQSSISGNVGVKRTKGNLEADSLTIDRDFVERWSSRYDEIFRDSYDQTEERAIRQWLSALDGPKYLNKEFFVRLGRWKTKRQTSNYLANDEAKVVQVTRSAFEASGDLVKLNILRESLRGVGVAVAATILHYLEPDVFPIFDYHARATLEKAKLWSRGEKDDSLGAWLEYNATMRDLSSRLGLTLRELDKALFAYDKYGPTRS